MPSLIHLEDFEAAARSILPQATFEYIAGGSGDDCTLRKNRAAFGHLEIMPALPRDVSKLDTTVRLFGREHSSPILLSPVGFHQLFHPNGERETVEGANQSDITLIASCFSTVTFEEMQRASSKPLWFQLYVQNDRGFTRELLERVVAAGAEAICVTVDLPTNAARDRERRADFDIPSWMGRANLEGMSSALAHASHASVGNLYNEARAADVTWQDFTWMRSFLKVPLLVKGILRAEDAEAAKDAGCDGVIISNHGGRALDGVPASITVLPEIAERIGGSMAVLLDGGVRRGIDVFKAIACGAHAVTIGRPYIYGLSTGGASGVATIVEILRREFAMAMSLSGCASIKSLKRDFVRACHTAGNSHG
ncbi:L-lactate dehydrogenase (plasmid) [Acidisarcina polymorpha]|uniref:L-lactate dehydrogenase n=1 Tax=Acidisarcina polymorpha TaxID=2211140 RepID=A0A2Z5GBD8_9BACT|nr:alpha-hydroxy acid oxidase [Acidisarcina polymorpha]AXC16024.1 L-lactate dehydrogenase [Acidisarcina polymorpha]